MIKACYDCLNEAVCNLSYLNKLAVEINSPIKKFLLQMMRKWVFSRNFDDSHVLSVHRLLHQKAAKNSPRILICVSLKGTYLTDNQVIGKFYSAITRNIRGYNLSKISNFHFPFMLGKTHRFEYGLRISYLLKINCSFVPRPPRPEDWFSLLSFHTFCMYNALLFVSGERTEMKWRSISSTIDFYRLFGSTPTFTLCIWHPH